MEFFCPKLMVPPLPQPLAGIFELRNPGCDHRIRVRRQALDALSAEQVLEAQFNFGEIALQIYPICAFGPLRVQGKIVIMLNTFTGEYPGRLKRTPKPPEIPTVGVPEITPVGAFNANPSGK